MNMPKIVQLEKHVAELIAAGEVVSRPASVVKELAENSIDAGAGIVTVEITGGGMTYIRVTDNGCGIAPDEVKTAFLRHATSKLQDASGLEAIETLGFRGEALSAIASVSRIELISRTGDADEGVRLIIEAGEPVSLTPAGCPVGTTIIVRDLFFNTPARLKFMKTDRAEGSAVSSVMLRCALSRPGISFRYIKDGKTEFHTPGDSRIDSCIYSLLGREIEAGFIPVELTDETVSVKGYTSSPSAARGNRSYQFFFINGRVIRSQLLQSAIEQAYKNTMTSGRYPACVLYITTNAGNVDVNVHPAKTEVRFISDKQVFDGVYYAVLGALEKHSAESVPGASIIPDKQDYNLALKAIPNLSAGSTADYPSARTHTGSYKPQKYSEDSAGFKNLSVEDYRSSFVSDVPVPYTPRLRVLGEVLSTYIVVECRESVWFIDKHAAHERIHYNALSGGKYSPMSQSLISPVICRVGCAEASLLLDNTEMLSTLGFTIDSFGEDSVAVRHIPSDIHERDVESVLSEICRHLTQSGTPASANLDKIHKSIACRAAIKAGSSTDMREMESLAERVMSGEISHCPHGRPTAFELSKSALEKSFGRV